MRWTRLGERSLSHISVTPLAPRPQVSRRDARTRAGGSELGKGSRGETVHGDRRRERDTPLMRELEGHENAVDLSTPDVSRGRVRDDENGPALQAKQDQRATGLE
jgi:hypothetical protein